MRGFASYDPPDLQAEYFGGVDQPLASSADYDDVVARAVEVVLDEAAEWRRPWRCHGGHGLPAGEVRELGVKSEYHRVCVLGLALVALAYTSQRVK